MADENKNKQAADRRFEFGKNWDLYLRDIDERHIGLARQSLSDMLGPEPLDGKSFLDAGSGSGLFSLAARELGADVHSFDYDEDSVTCTQKLKDRYCSGDPRWTISRGDVLNRDWLDSLGQFDIVYSWGVLHHTGNMTLAMENICRPVRRGGTLFIALYNNQGWQSLAWKAVKAAYNKSPKMLKPAILMPALARIWGLTIIRDTFKMAPLKTWKEYHKTRGMSPYRDVVDWVGGYPFETASPAKVEQFFAGRGFSVRKRNLSGGYGCNEFIFKKDL